MNIRFHALVLFFLTPLLCLANKQPDYNIKQKAILLLNSLDQQVWKSTAPHTQPDPLFTLQPTLDALPGLPATATFFVRHTPRVLDAQNLINPLAFEDSFLAPFIPSAEKIHIHEHAAGVHIGQLWSQDNLEIAWQWWAGIQARNWWISGKDRTAFLETFKNYTAPISKGEAQDVHAPQPIQNRLTPWHATNVNVGIGDVHVQVRYRLPLHQRFYCAIGPYITVPIGTQANYKTPRNGMDNPPLGGDELVLRLINRAREIMLATPLGSNGHLGLGAQVLAQLILTDHWSIKGQFMQMHYRSGVESRYALSTGTVINALEEGLPSSAENISSDEAVWDHLKHKLYPTEIKVSVRPGMLRMSGIALHYNRAPFHVALGYWHEHKGAEYSDSAPLATLTRRSFENHRITGTCGLRQRHNWGEASTYLTGSYAPKGTNAGAWSVGIGATVQA